MRHIIRVEETIKAYHNIIVDIDDDEQIDAALENTEGCDNLDDYVDAISDIIPVLEVHEECYIETDSLEYFDDYEDDSE